MDIQRHLQAIDEGARRLADSAEWQNWLDYQRKFHDYSFGNCVLIAAQCPTATQIAGYRTWQSLGRQVRKGEKGLRILAPMFVHKQGGDENERKLLFRDVAVFDISQTEGDPLPACARRIASADHADLFRRLAQAADTLGYSVELGDTGEMSGWVEHRAKRIMVNGSVAVDQRVKTLTHELGHILCGHSGEARPNRSIVELEAESVAYCLCAEAGLDTSGYTFAYVTSWAGGDKALTTALKASASIIAKAVKRLWALVEGEREQTVEAMAAA